IAARRKLASCRILRMKRSGDAHRKHGHLVGIRPKLLDCDPPELAAHRKDESRAAESGASEKADDRPPPEPRQIGAMRPEDERQSGSSRDRRGDRPRGDDPVGEDTIRSKLLHDLGEATARREVETKEPPKRRPRLFEPFASRSVIEALDPDAEPRLVLWIGRVDTRRDDDELERLRCDVEELTVEMLEKDCAPRIL